MEAADNSRQQGLRLLGNAKVAAIVAEAQDARAVPERRNRTPIGVESEAATSSTRWRWAVSVQSKQGPPVRLEASGRIFRRHTCERRAAFRMRYAQTRVWQAFRPNYAITRGCGVVFLMDIMRAQIGAGPS